MNVRLERRADGVVLFVRAQAGARRNGFSGVHAGMLKVTVTQVAQKGKANEAIVEVLRKRLDLRRSQIRLLSGKTTSNKTFLIERTDFDTLANRISEQLKKEEV